MRHLIPPQQRLTIALGQRGEAAAGPEGFADIPNGAFHAALLVSGAHLARARHAVIVGAQLHQARVEVDLVAAPLQHGTAEIVVENHSAATRPGLKGVHMAAQEVLHVWSKKNSRYNARD